MNTAPNTTSAPRAPHRHQFSAKSTATEAQIQKLIALLSIRPRHTYELRMLGISHPAGRILDLVKRGFLFESKRVTTIDSDGFTHHGVALYTMLSAPSGEGVLL